MRDTTRPFRIPGTGDPARTYGAASRSLRPVSFRRSPKRSELIARDLAAYIADQDLPPGTPLASEVHMATELGVGRASVREALRLLETRGVLTVHAGAGGGPVVRRPQPEDLRESLTLILEFQGTKLTEVLDTRRLIEITTARLAAARITTDEVRTLREINELLIAAEDDVDKGFVYNEQFHLTLCTIGGNTVFRAVLESIIAMDVGKLLGMRYPTSWNTKMHDDHEDIIGALEAGDGAAASQAMDEHITRWHEELRSRDAGIDKHPVRWMT